MKHPFFSIIVPIYNTDHDYLRDCIRSFTQQTFADFEVLLIDDGSEKACGDLCDQYAASDERIKVIHQENQGVSAARNRGICEAQADWILFVDADDWLEPDACERLSVLLNQHDCDILQFNLVKDYANTSKKLNYGFEDGCLYETKNVETREFLYRRAMGAPISGAERVCPIYYSCDKVIKRSFLVNNHLTYPVGLPKSEDKVFFLSCFTKLERLYYVQDALYHYRINSVSACNKYSETADTDRIYLAQLLQSIAAEMDHELGLLKNDPNYDQITKDYLRFIFGISSDVLLLKYYHPNYPRSKRMRSAEAKKFLNTEPFRSAIRNCSYHGLSKDAKLKKFLLSNGMPFAFCSVFKLYNRLTGKTTQE